MADTTSYSARRRARRQTRGGSGIVGRYFAMPMWARLAVGIPCGLLALVLVLVLADVAVSFGRVHPGVTVAGVPIGGLDREMAQGRLSASLEARLAKPVAMRYDSGSWNVQRRTIDVQADAAASVDRAFKVGRRGPLYVMVSRRISAAFSGIDLPAAIDCDEVKADALFDDVDKKIAVPARDARVTIEGTQPIITASSTGRRVHRRLAEKDLLAAFASGRDSVTLVAEPVAPKVSNEAARKAATEARVFLSGPVTVRYKQQSWTFGPEKIAKWVVFKAVPEASAETSGSTDTETAPEADGAPGSTWIAPGARYVLRTTLGTVEVSSTLTPLTGGIGTPAVDAKFVVEGRRVKVVGGQSGMGPDIPALVETLEASIRSGGDRSAVLRLAVLEPALTAERARSMGIVERISTYTTSYSSGASQRVNNIHTLARALDEKLVPPGGVFDFNASVGERTAAKGYKEAPAIVKGKLVPQLGGGICQIGTTFFNTVFFSGLPVIERTNHSFYISHYPRGRDCTVSWGGPNFRWKNDTSSWILIKTSYSSSSVTISLYGTDPGYDVGYTTGPFTDARPFKITEVEDPTLPAGSRVVEDGGVSGGKVKVVRIVKKDGQVVREDTFMSYYRPKEETVRVGTKAAPKPVVAPPSKPATRTR